MNIIPAFLRKKIEDRPNLLKAIDNIGWLFFERFLRMGIGLLVGVWIARYLGPEKFGLLNFSIAFTGLFIAIATLGLEGILVRDLVQDPDKAGTTLGTAAAMQLVGGLAAYLIILFVISIMRPDDPLAQSIVAIVGSLMLLKASDIATFWFESKIQSKYTVLVQTSVLLIFAIVKCFQILNEAPLINFAWTMLAEAITTALLNLAVMSKLGIPLLELDFSITRAKTLISNSWPLILSAISITIYMRIDQLMLGQMVGNDAVGVYAAASRISEAWYFIPVAIIASTFPKILEMKTVDAFQYKHRLQQLYNIMAMISLTAAITITVFSVPLIEFLYGDAYIQSATILAIHVWGSIFIFMGVVGEKHLVAANLQIVCFQRTALGAAVNIALNTIFIPHYGPIGAAIATVISQAIAAFFADILQTRTRDLFSMKLRALNLRSSILSLTRINHVGK